MLLSEDRVDENSLAALGVEATRLLCAGEIDVLSAQLGYALAYDRNPADVIREDLTSSLTAAGARRLVQPNVEVPKVSYFKPNDTGLFALVECFIPTDGGSPILLEIIVTYKGAKIYATLEQIS